MKIEENKVLMIDSFLLNVQMMPELIILILLYQIVILIIIKYILKNI